MSDESVKNIYLSDCRKRSESGKKIPRFYEIVRITETRI